MCAQMSTELVSVVPQVADYLCPVCFTIAYRPIRLTCRHVFCIRCVVKLQRRRETLCPLCRSDTVMTATPGMKKPSPPIMMIAFDYAKLTRRRQPRPKAPEFHEEVLSQGDQGKTESQRR
ncbi:hypothetical protein IMZ48_29700 [Candidatus Bathyarchaeota archaeon]|nr:hypothetical protein [Candidatus Bathyarchaeota archaeon]